MTEKIERNREFHSLKEFQKVVFPNFFKRKEEERILKNRDFGKILAHNFIDNIRKAIKEKLEESE